MEQLTLIEDEQITPRSGAKKYKENVLVRKEREHIDENIQRFLQLQQLPYESKLSHAAKMAKDFIIPSLLPWENITQTVMCLWADLTALPCCFFFAV